ncbi:MAG: energy-coupling factor transporter ATPase [Anaerolineae bacterium]
MAFIRTSHLSHLFPAQPQPIAALQDLSLEIDRGDYVAIVGANGSGKSTLARHFNALLLPTTGDVWVNEENTRDPARLRAIRQAVAMVFQNPENQFVATIAQEDVAFGPENFGVPRQELKTRVDAAIAAVGLESLRERAPHELSAGQQQRLAIAGALALQPSALVLDEATSMLDPRGKRAVMDLALRLHAEGLTVAAITQSMEEAARAARVVVMAQGRIVAAGAPQTIFADAARLTALDLDLPPYAEIAQALAARLPGFPAHLLTLDELVAAIGEYAGHRQGTKDKTVSGQSAILPPVAGPASPILSVRALHHTYLRGAPRAYEALRGVDIDIYPGEIVGILGAAGSGKSTLLQHFNGLIRPRPGEGEVMVDGVNLSDPRADVHALRQRVGLVFQFSERQLFERYVGDDIAFGPRQFGYDRPEVRRRVQQAMTRVGLDFESFKDRVTLTLSGGQKRRAAIAGVLALEPKVLALDEPTAGLDPRGRRELLAALLQWRDQEGLTLVLVSHHMDEIAQVCDRVHVLEAGIVAFTGSPRELFYTPGLDRFGLTPPPAVQLMHALRARGLPVAGNAMTIPEAVAELKRLT